MPGEPDALYVAARRTLLDVLEAIVEHREAVVLVGAQAVYLVTGEGDLAVAPFTLDADLALNPALLQPNPRLEVLLAAAGFVPAIGKVGTWTSRGGIDVDLLVPEAMGGTGRRAARIPPHREGVARKARGLEAALVDQERVVIMALEEGDERRFNVASAGPGALLVAKLLKIQDRAGTSTRLEDKDALDVLRLLRATTTANLVIRLRQLRVAEVSRDVTDQALHLLREMFGTPNAAGSQMAVRATGGLEDPSVIAASCATLASDVVTAMRWSDEDRE